MTRTAPRKPAAKKAAPARKPAPPKVAAKPAKKQKKDKKSNEGKVKVVRDSFTMPQSDYDLIAALKHKAVQAGVHAKKSELLRAGLQALSKLSAAQLKRAVADLEKIKTGRPKKA